MDGLTAAVVMAAAVSEARNADRTGWVSAAWSVALGARSGAAAPQRTYRKARPLRDAVSDALGVKIRLFLRRELLPLVDRDRLMCPLPRPENPCGAPRLRSRWCRRCRRCRRWCSR